jgi:peptidyl-prolyl cis-trans isomerase C
MRKTLALIALAATVAAAPVFAQTPAASGTQKPAAAKPAGKALYSQKTFDYFLKQRIAQGAPDSPELQAAIREELNTRELLLREAKKNGLDKKDAVKTDMELASQMVLIRSFLADWISKNPVPESELRKEYDAVKAQLGDKEFKVAHILVENEGEAKDIIKNLQSGKKFADLAKQHSKDPGSQEKGGELGWNTPSNFVKPFGDALPKIAKGKFTATPVQSPYGWHVIMVEDVRDTKLPSYEELKPQLQQRAQAIWLERYFEQLRSKAGV